MTAQPWDTGIWRQLGYWALIKAFAERDRARIREASNPERKPEPTAADPKAQG